MGGGQEGVMSVPVSPLCCCVSPHSGGASRGRCSRSSSSASLGGGGDRESGRGHEGPRASHDGGGTTHLSLWRRWTCRRPSSAPKRCRAPSSSCSTNRLRDPGVWERQGGGARETQVLGGGGARRPRGRSQASRHSHGHIGFGSQLLLCLQQVALYGGGGGACHHPQGSQASTGGGARRLGGGARPPWGRSQASVGAEPQAPRGLTLAQQLLPCLLQLHQFSLQLGGGLQERGHRGGEEGTPQGWGRGDAEVGGTGHPRGPGLTCASRRCLCSSVMSSSCCQNSCLQGRVRQVSCDTHVT